MAIGHPVTELRYDGGHGHHECQVEQQLELRRRPVRLVDGARRHRDPERDPGVRRAGLRIGPSRHVYSQSSCQE
jgi:hypothetical protein